MKKLLGYILYMIIEGEWNFGFGCYSNKPMLGFFHIYYDGDNYAFHFGPFWIECYC